MMCKRALDAAREQFLRQYAGLECEMITYVDSNVTAENRLVVAKKSVKRNASTNEMEDASV